MTGLGLGCSNEENTVPALGSSRLRGETDAWAALVPRALRRAEWAMLSWEWGPSCPASCRTSWAHKTNQEHCLGFEHCSALW